MPRNSPTADETVTVRLPRGTADKLRAASGQKFSTLVRFMCVGLLEHYAGQQRQTDSAQEVKDVVQNLAAPK